MLLWFQFSFVVVVVVVGVVVIGVVVGVVCFDGDLFLSVSLAGDMDWKMLAMALTLDPILLSRMSSLPWSSNVILSESGFLPEWPELTE